MTAVAFHTGIGDALGYACRLLRKAYRQGARVSVTGDPPLLSRLDQALWTFEPLAFVPHALLRRGASPSGPLARTPIWLLEPGAEPPHRQVVVNLGPEPLVDPGAFERVIELVGDDAESLAAGRRRWRHYESRGLMVHHAAQRGRE